MFNAPRGLLGDWSVVTIEPRVTTVQQGGRQGCLEYSSFDSKWNIIVFVDNLYRLQCVAHFVAGVTSDGCGSCSV